MIQNYEIGPRFFIEKLSAMDISDTWADISVTAYKLSDPKIIAATKLLSPKRWMDTLDCVLKPGHGEGIAILDACQYQIDYAWKGLSESDVGLGNTANVINWTIRLKAKESSNFRSTLEQVMKEIITVEGGLLEYEISVDQLLNNYMAAFPMHVPQGKNQTDLFDVYTQFCTNLNNSLPKSDKQKQSEIVLAVAELKRLYSEGLPKVIHNPFPAVAKVQLYKLLTRQDSHSKYRKRGSTSSITPELNMPVIWNDDGTKNRGEITNIFPGEGQYSGRTMYEVTFKNRLIGTYTRLFDNICFSENLRVDTRRLNKR